MANIGPSPETSAHSVRLTEWRQTTVPLPLAATYPVRPDRLVGALAFQDAPGYRVYGCGGRCSAPIMAAPRAPVPVPGRFSVSAGGHSTGSLLSDSGS